MDLQTTISIIFLIVLVSIIILEIFWKIKRNGLKETIKGFIIAAEKLFQYKDNANKIKYVVDHIYDNYIPSFFKLYITRGMVENFVNIVFKEFKEELDRIISDGGTNE